MFEFLIPALVIVQSPPPPPPPTITIDRDNVEITASCVVQIGANPIVDSDNNCVIHITRAAITVDFNNQRLHGAKSDQTPDTFGGFGIKITAKDVTLKNAKISGFKVGVHAINADGLTIHDCDVSNNFHQRLKSTPQAEDASDWLWPHANDNNEWMTNYGAGICVEDSTNVRLHDIRARKTQNGIILDRVDDSKVYDCDCSFLSGWGLAMWRSSKNVISRNAFDFCVRGYSHGVYNRGQDSAGILMFEQCCKNQIIQNSVTHGGDGVFGFAGKEALGEVAPQADLEWYRSRGCNNNIFTQNDLSFAAAHGLELTFSFDNWIQGNTFHSNAICGVWGGYSQRTHIHANQFYSNGDAAYGLERGGINIEHGRENIFSGNAFDRNECAIHLWWDEDKSIETLPWSQVNGTESKQNQILLNSFSDNAIAVQLRDSDSTLFSSNEHKPEVRIEADERSRNGISSLPNVHSSGAPVRGLMGQETPVNARLDLRGRENIIITEWGPWDHESPLLRFEKWFDHAHEYKLLGAKKMPAGETIHAEGDVELEVHDAVISVRPTLQNTLVPYAIAVEINGERADAKGMLSTGVWEVWTFKSACDPREDVERWRREGTAEHHTLTADTLDFRFDSGGMSDVRHLPVKLPTDHFGVFASRLLTIPVGKWRLQTTSDDGIRVWMDDQLVIDDWTWHAPARHDYEFEVKEPREHKFRVEYFELDGYAVFSLEFEKVETAD